MSDRQLLSDLPTQEELASIQTGMMMDAIRALVDETASVIRNEDGEAIGVEWPYEGCTEGLYWDADWDVVQHKASAGR